MPKNQLPASTQIRHAQGNARVETFTRTPTNSTHPYQIQPTLKPADLRGAGRADGRVVLERSHPVHQGGVPARQPPNPQPREPPGFRNAT